MTDTQWKQVNLSTGTVPPRAFGTIQASYPNALKSEFWENDIGALDVPYSRAWRLICRQHNGGSASWLVLPDGSEVGSSQVYPEENVEREILRTKAMITPGSQLVCNLICINSGWTEKAPSLGGWTLYNKAGSVKVTVSLLNEDGDTLSTAFSVDCPVEEKLNSTNDWQNIHLRLPPFPVHPPLLQAAPLEKNKWAEWPQAEIVITHTGAPRVVEASIWEAPWQHTRAHDTEDTSISSWSPVGVPTSKPQIRDKSGATFDEYRFGTEVGYRAAQRQQKFYGPHLARWCSYAEDLAEVADVRPDPVQVTSTTWVGISVGSNQTSWSDTAPGYSFRAPPNGRTPDNLHTRLRSSFDEDGEYWSATIPVRVGVYARFTADGGDFGYVKFQTSARSWVIIPINQEDEWRWYETTAWLEAGATGLDYAIQLQDFGKVDSGTMEISNWYVDYGDAPL